MDPSQKSLTARRVLLVYKKDDIPVEREYEGHKEDTKAGVVMRCCCGCVRVSLTATQWHTSRMCGNGAGFIVLHYIHSVHCFGGLLGAPLFCTCKGPPPGNVDGMFVVSSASLLM